MSGAPDKDAPGMIVVMGVTGAGKSHFINQLAGTQAVKEGDTLDPCTQDCQLVPILVGRSKLLLIDTPGFDDSERTDSEILMEIARILSAQYKLGIELKGIIYIHRITDIRYTRASIKTFEIFRKLCGEKALSNVMLVTSRWKEIDPAVGANRERQLKEKFWAYMLGKGSNMSRFHGDRPSAVGLVGQLLCKDSVVLTIQQELVDEGKSLDETTAGTYVNDSLESLRGQYQEELASLQRLKDDLQEKDRSIRRKLDRDSKEEEARLKQVDKDQDHLHHPVGAEVDQEIRQKRSRMSKVLPFAPTVICLLSQFFLAPLGITDTITTWFSDLGTDAFAS